MNMQRLRERRAKNIQKTEVMLDRLFGSGAPVQMSESARRTAALILPWLYVAAAIYLAYIAKELIEWNAKFGELLGAFTSPLMSSYLYFGLVACVILIIILVIIAFGLLLRRTSIWRFAYLAMYGGSLAQAFYYLLKMVLDGDGAVGFIISVLVGLANLYILFQARSYFTRNSSR